MDAPAETPAPAAPKTVLLVDDRDESRLTTKWFLAHFGFEIDTAKSAEDALAKFDPALHQAVITDNSMRGGMSGAQMARVMKQRAPATPVLMYSGQPPADVSSLDFVLQKPAHLLDLKEALDRLLAAKLYLSHGKDPGVLPRPITGQPPDGEAAASRGE